MKTILKLREQIVILLVEWTKPIYVWLFKRKQRVWQQSIQSLKRFPPNTLGSSLGAFLEKNNFSLIPKLEDHDVLHVLLNYQPTIEGEISMQCFLLGNRKRSLYALFTALIGFILVPEQIKVFIQEFRKGRQSVSVSNWDFEYLLSEPLELLQKQIFRKELKYQPFRI